MGEDIVDSRDYVRKMIDDVCSPEIFGCADGVSEVQKAEVCCGANDPAARLVLQIV